MTVRSFLVVLIMSSLLPLTAGAAGTGSFSVTSSLDGKTTLPHRTVWVGYTSLASSKVESVEFVVDGKMRWTEHKGPYIYAGDDAGKNRGYFVSSWLKPGMHRFEVRVNAKDGGVASDKFTARVLPSPSPPVALAGTWQRTLASTADAPKVGSAGNLTGTYVPPGTYHLTFESRWMRDKFPGKFVYPASNKTGNGFVFLSDYTASATRIHVVGEVIFHPVLDTLAEGGAWCRFNGPAADYNWSVSGETLTLSPVGGKDACGIRGYIWAGEWTRR
jgi:hypothetical protein